MYSLTKSTSTLSILTLLLLSLMALSVIVIALASSSKIFENNYLMFITMGISILIIIVAVIGIIGVGKEVKVLICVF
jgi:hypothetical protein